MVPTIILTTGKIFNGTMFSKIVKRDILHSVSTASLSCFLLLGNCGISCFSYQNEYLLGAIKYFQEEASRLGRERVVSGPSKTALEAMVLQNTGNQ